MTIPPFHWRIASRPGGLYSIRVAFEALVELCRGRRLAILTGAGVSTESGIPDYRGPETRRRARNPIRFREFMGDETMRRRYWARAMVGWQKFANKRPNPAHAAIAEMERDGKLSGLITQNVDRLHHAAGSKAVVELHGSMHSVVCLECGEVSARAALQARLAELNPAWVGRDAQMAPDADAEIDDTESFVVVDCERCEGPLKPWVVFFGESVPKPRVEQAFQMVDDAEVLLVIGSSLAVFSGYRFVRHAARKGQPVAILNLGETRGDPHACVRVEGKAGQLLPRLAEALR